MREAVICEPLRTPVGGFGGVLKDVPVQELAAIVIRELLARTDLPAQAVDDVILGQCYPNGEAPALGRVAALDAGLPVDVPGHAGGPALRLGTAGDRSGLHAGPDRRRRPRAGRRRGEHEPGRVLRHRHPLGGDGRLGEPRTTGSPAGGSPRADATTRVPGGMIETAENLRREYSISRVEAGRARAALPPPRRGGPGGRPLRPGDRPRHRP